ncbi:HU family DNA-binding protein, partial [Parabacteroides leei]
MMNKRELIYSIAEKTGYTQSAVRNVLNTFIDTVFE